MLKVRLFPAVSRKSSSMLEVDDEGGRMFLRVLIHLTMHDYPPLISGSLQLLFKHFSQRQEVLHTFKQVMWGGGSWHVPLALKRGMCKRAPSGQRGATLPRCKHQCSPSWPRPEEGRVGKLFGGRGVK